MNNLQVSENNDSTFEADHPLSKEQPQRKYPQQAWAKMA